MPRKKPIPKGKFGRIRVIREVEPKRRASGVGWTRMVLCKCDCGAEVTLRLKLVKSGNTSSCGCLKREGDLQRFKARITHGLTGHYICKIWQGMLSRCYNPEHRSYGQYGGRGVCVCERWRESPVNLLEDMGERPSKDHSLDRIDVNGNYEPGNVRWATRSQQQRNRRDSVRIEVGGEVRSVHDWSDLAGGNPSAECISLRIKAGWPPERAVSIPSSRGSRA
jgi:hypothetical protein